MPPWKSSSAAARQLCGQSRAMTGGGSWGRASPTVRGNSNLGWLGPKAEPRGHGIKTHMRAHLRVPLCSS